MIIHLYLGKPPPVVDSGKEASTNQGKSTLLDVKAIVGTYFRIGCPCPNVMKKKINSWFPHSWSKNVGFPVVSWWFMAQSTAWTDVSQLKTLRFQLVHPETPWFPNKKNQPLQLSHNNFSLTRHRRRIMRVKRHGVELGHTWPWKNRRGFSWENWETWGQFMW